MQILWSGSTRKWIKPKFWNKKRRFCFRQGSHVAIHELIKLLSYFSIWTYLMFSNIRNLTGRFTLGLKELLSVLLLCPPAIDSIVNATKLFTLIFLDITRKLTLSVLALLLFGTTHDNSFNFWDWHHSKNVAYTFFLVSKYFRLLCFSGEEHFV